MNRLIPLFFIFILPGMLIAQQQRQQSAVIPERIYVLHESDAVFMRFKKEIALSKRYRGRYVREYTFPALEYAEYYLKPGDSLPSVAARLGISVDAIASASGVVYVYAPASHDRVLIPNFDGISYASSSSCTLAELAEKYDVPVSDIMRFNGFARNRLARGERLFIPGASMDPLEQGMFYGTAFASPLQEVLLSSAFGSRSDPFTGHRAFHGGVDLAAPAGTPVYATKEGVVEFSGWSGGYGNLVVIRHAFGYRTLYGHLASREVASGDRLRAGQALGRVGSTGYSTGPHLHFELQHHGQAIDPMRYSTLQHRDRPAALPVLL